MYDVPTPAPRLGPEDLQRDRPPALDHAVRTVTAAGAAGVALVDGVERVEHRRAQHALARAAGVVGVELARGAAVVRVVAAVVVVVHVGQARAAGKLAAQPARVALAAGAEAGLGRLDAVAVRRHVGEAKVGRQHRRIARLVDHGDGDQALVRELAQLAPVAGGLFRARGPARTRTAVRVSAQMEREGGIG